MRHSLFALALTLALPAQADIAARFIEGAPKDRFQIINLSACATGPIDIVIDLSTADAGLIFDTTASGAGVEVYQPMELVSGAELVEAQGRITDGDNVISLRLSDLPGDAIVAFTVDVDDTEANSALGQIRVAGSEINEATFRWQSDNGDNATAVFDRSGRATSLRQGCIS